MNEPVHKSDSDLIVTMTIGQLRELIRFEITAAGNGRAGPDSLVNIDKAATMLDVTADWLYHNRKTLPFVRKLGRKVLRFSVNGMQKWMEAKKFS